MYVFHSPRFLPAALGGLLLLTHTFAWTNDHDGTGTAPTVPVPAQVDVIDSHILDTNPAKLGTEDHLIEDYLTETVLVIQNENGSSYLRGTETTIDAQGIQSAVKSSKSSKSSKECFKASMEPFTNGGVFFEYPTIKGQVKICFDETLELNSSYPTTTAGVLMMSVTGLINGTRAPSPGGVHIHSGPNCTSLVSQQGHFFKNCTGSANFTGRKKDCDPWYNNVDPSIAPTGTKYTVDKRGKGKANFKFDQGYGYNDTVGKVVVVHLGINATDYSTIRIACGKLVAASD